MLRPRGQALAARRKINPGARTLRRGIVGPAIAPIIVPPSEPVDEARHSNVCRSACQQGNRPAENYSRHWHIVSPKHPADDDTDQQREYWRAVYEMAADRPPTIVSLSHRRMFSRYGCSLPFGARDTTAGPSTLPDSHRAGEQPGPAWRDACPGRCSALGTRQRATERLQRSG